VTNEDDLPSRDRWARLRFAIIGPLLAAPPPPGALRAALTALAAKTWRHPFTGDQIRFGVSTLERWFSAQSKIMRSSSTRKSILSANSMT
jgi:putative transposase